MSLVTFLRDFQEAIRDQTAAVFAGAGLSIPAGLVNWHDLLKDIAADIGLDIGQEQDLVAVAQYHVNESGGRHKLNQALVNEFASRAIPTENHRILASLPIRTYWTTNYDTLIEDALRNSKKRVDVKLASENLALTLPRRDAIVYKMHGDVSLPDKAVLTKDDYEAYNESRQLFSTALQGDLVSKTFLFLGFSFSDPNLGYVLGRIRVLLGKSQRQHYCLLRKVARTDFTSDAEFHYAQARQTLQVKDLRRYGIEGLLLDTYSDHTSVLADLAQRYKRHRVFVSGSASSYAPWKPTESELFLAKLGDALIDRELDVVSGFGVGVGSFVLNGAIQALERSGSYSAEDRITLRPFPQGILSPDERALRWREYRRDMLSNAGISIVVFGNRTALGGTIELAAGVAQEFELAAEQGMLIVPVGATGYMAKELHQRMLDDFLRFYPGRHDLLPAFQSLGEVGTPEAVLGRVLRFLDLIRGVG